MESLEYVNNYPLPTSAAVVTTAVPPETKTEEAVIGIDGFAEFKPDDFTTELKYSLWTDLSGEQSEF